MAPWCIHISCLERVARSGSGRHSVRGLVGAMDAELSRPDWLATVQSGRKQVQSRVCTPSFKPSLVKTTEVQDNSIVKTVSKRPRQRHRMAFLATSGSLRSHDPERVDSIGGNVRLFTAAATCTSHCKLCSLRANARLFVLLYTFREHNPHHRPLSRYRPRRTLPLPFIII